MRKGALWRPQIIVDADSLLDADALGHYTLSSYSCGLGDNKECLMLGKDDGLPVFVELPPFERSREDYLDDDEYLKLQIELIKNPNAGDVIQGASGLRKLRYGDKKRGKGKKGGLPNDKT